MGAGADRGRVADVRVGGGNGGWSLSAVFRRGRRRALGGWAPFQELWGVIDMDRKGASVIPGGGLEARLSHPRWHGEREGR